MINLILLLLMNLASFFDAVSGIRCKIICLSSGKLLFCCLKAYCNSIASSYEISIYPLILSLNLHALSSWTTLNSTPLSYCFLISPQINFLMIEVPYISPPLSENYSIDVKFVSKISQVYHWLSFSQLQPYSDICS